MPSEQTAMPTLRVDDSPAALAPDAWNRLLAASAQPTPFMRHEYLQALHDSGSAVADTGWQPMFLSVWDEARLLAACPAWLKTHSYGEYVFDWAWADAYRRHGLRYYPKLLVAVPFTPVPGTRLMARDDGARRALLQALHQFAVQQGLSSAHVLFHDDADASALQGAGWLARHNVQFHWTRAAAGAPETFEAFLKQLQRDKRKKIQQERRKVAEAGVAFSVHDGAEITTALWDFFHRCYVAT